MNQQKQWLFEVPATLESSLSAGDAMADFPKGKGGKSIDRVTLGKRVVDLRSQILAARKQAGGQQKHCRDQIDRFDVAWRRVVTSLQRFDVPAFTLARQFADLESRTTELLTCLGFASSSFENNPEFGNNFESETEWELQEASSAALGEEEWERSPRSSPRRQTLRATVSGFSRYSNAIPPQEKAKVRRFARLIVHSHRSGQPIRTVRLVGHADRDVQRGAMFEKKISGDRALEVKKHLINAIKNPTIAARISWKIEASGATRLAVPNPQTENDRRRNRRVDVILPVSCGALPIYRPFMSRSTLVAAHQSCGTPPTASTLSIGQVVEVEVRESDGSISTFSHQYPVNLNNSLRIPSIGSVRATGLTLIQLRQAIINAFVQKQILSNPTVNVALSTKTVNYSQPIKIGDKLFLRILAPDGKVEPSSGQYTVDSQGRLHVPLIGDVNAAGKPITVLENEIETGLKVRKMLLDPVVHLSLIQLN